jgi:hypothetical protein
MELVQEIVVFLENKPGVLARLTAALAARKISILGFSLQNALDHGAIRMVVSKPTEALHLLGEHGMLAFANEMLWVKVRNQAGAMAEVADALSKAKVSVEYAYGSAGPSAKAHGFYLRVSNAKKAMDVLAKVEGVE